MDLDKILQNMDAQDSQTKTASVAGSTGEAEAQALTAALEKVAGVAAPAPVAVEQNPIDGLAKMAAEMAGTEAERDIALSAMCGSAFADNAIAKMAAYDAEARLEMAKTAAAQPEQFVGGEQFTVEDIQKIAMDATIGTLEHLSAGQPEEQYVDTQEKIAEEYGEGWDAALQHTYDATSNEFFKGAAEAEIMVQLAQAQE